MSSKATLKNSTEIKITAYLFVAAWVLMVLFLLSALTGYLFYKNEIGTTVIEIITLSMLVGLLLICISYFVLSLLVRCPNCKNRIFSEKEKMHPRAKKSILGFSGFVAEEVIKNNQFTCAHCGEHFYLGRE